MRTDKPIQIVGRLEDRSIYTTVAYTEHIYDNALDKKQDVINQEILEAIDALQNTDTNNKGLYESIGALRTAIPNPKTGDWAIVRSGDNYYICVCDTDGVWKLTDNTWEPEEIDLSKYATKEDLKDAVNGLLTKDDADLLYAPAGTTGSGYTEAQVRNFADQQIEAYFNEHPLTGGAGSGGGDINVSELDKRYVLRSSQDHPDESHLVASDINELVRNTLDDINNPIRLSFSVSPSVIKVTSATLYSVVASWSLTKKNVAVPVKSVNVSVDSSNQASGNQTAASSGNVRLNLGIGSHTIYCTVEDQNGNKYTSSASVRFYYSSYMGYTSAQTMNQVNLNSLSEYSLSSSIKGTYQIDNPTTGYYLWIVTPYTLGIVATDPGGQTRVDMNYIGNDGTRNYYRSNLSVDKSNLTYYLL